MEIRKRKVVHDYNYLFPGLSDLEKRLFEMNYFEIGYVDPIDVDGSPFFVAVTSKWNKMMLIISYLKGNMNGGHITPDDISKFLDNESKFIDNEEIMNKINKLRLVVGSIEWFNHYWEGKTYDKWWKRKI